MTTTQTITRADGSTVTCETDGDWKKLVSVSAIRTIAAKEKQNIARAVKFKKLFIAVHKKVKKVLVKTPDLFPEPKPKDIMIRPCMCCHNPFHSEGKHNRLCNLCSHLRED